VIEIETKKGKTEKKKTKEKTKSVTNTGPSRNFQLFQYATRRLPGCYKIGLCD
jgi:hypothetical protein